MHGTAPCIGPCGAAGPPRPPRVGIRAGGGARHGRGVPIPRLGFPPRPTLQAVFPKGRFACPDEGGDVLLRDQGGGVHLDLPTDGVRGDVRGTAAERARQVFSLGGFMGRGAAKNSPCVGAVGRVARHGQVPGVARDRASVPP